MPMLAALASVNSVMRRPSSPAGGSGPDDQLQAKELCDMVGRHHKLLAPRSGEDMKMGDARMRIIEMVSKKTKGRCGSQAELQISFGDVLTQDTDHIGYFEFVDSLPQKMGEISSYPCNKEEASTIASFIEMNSSRKVDTSQLSHAVRLWTLVNMYRAEWQPILQEGQDYQDEHEAMRKLMNSINTDEKANDEEKGCVTNEEVDWVLEMASAFCRLRSQKQTTTLLAVSHWLLLSQDQSKGILVRDLLIERLELEQKFRHGCCRFLLLVVFFSLFTQTISISGKINQCRSIRNALIPRFDLESIKEVTSLEEVKDFITGFSEKAADMSPTSLSYFGEAKSMKILSTPEKFSEKRVLPQVDLGMGRGFTLQAWMRVEPNTVIPKGGLPIFRRALKAVGAGSDLSCLSWNFPPSLAFGAHDYGMKGPNSVTDLNEEFVRSSGVASTNYNDILTNGGIYEGVEVNHLTMHTLVVNMTTATFFINNGQVLSTQVMSRMVTDCAGAQSTVGDAGLYLATVLYTPRALSSKEVDEIYQQGGLLGNMGYNIFDPTLGSLTHLNEIANKITENKEQADDAQVSRQRHTEAQNSLAVQAMMNPLAPPDPYSNMAHTVKIITDPVLGIPVWDIINYTYVSPESQIRIAGDALPRATATKGFAVSAWIKFKQAGNGYLIARGLPALESGTWKFTGYSDMCWFIYIGGSATEFRLRSVKTGEEYGASAMIADKQAPDDTQFREQSYRHFFAQVDPTATGPKARLCIDGECGLYLSMAPGVSASSGPPVDCEDSSYTDLRFPDAAERAEALNRTSYFINRRPPGMWPLTAEIKNLKMFDRVLTPAEELKLRMEDRDPMDPSKPISTNGGCRDPSDMVDDPTFIDDFGHTCLWYYQTRMDNLPNCERNPKAAMACPVACNSAEVCWGKAAILDSSDVFNVWEQQMEIRTTGSWGTTCVAKSTTAEKEAIRCGLNAPNFTRGCAGLGVQNCGPVDCSAFENDREGLMNCLGDLTWTMDQDAGPKHRFVPCAEIVRTHVPSCDWDDEGLDAIAAKINGSSEFSFTFWVESILTEDCLQPQMRFIDGDGLTFAWIAGWEEVELDPPAGTGCNNNFWYSFDMHGLREDGHKTVGGADVAPEERPVPGKKHLMIVGRQERPDRKVVISFDTKTLKGGFDAAMQVPPLKANKDFLRVINIAGDVRLSAIQITPKFPETGTMAKYNYNELPHQALRRGTEPTLTEQLDHSFRREADLFKQKMFLVSPPLLVQSRKQAADCNWDFSNSVVERYWDTAHRRHCTAPYSCDDYTKKNVYQCPSVDESGLFFGLSPTLIMDKLFYAEFLATITNNPIVVRPDNDGTLGVLATDEFLDTLTSELKVMGIFYSPEYEITSNLVVEFIFDDKGISARFDLRNYVALTGDDFQTFIIFQWWLIMAVEVILFFELFLKMRELKAEKVIQGHWNQHVLTVVTIDFLIQLTTLIYFVMIHLVRAESGEITESFVGKLVNMEWDSSDTGFQEKKSTFLDTFNNLGKKIQYSEGVETFGMFTAIVLFLRMVIATSAHPRIALISSTLNEACSDMMHFFGVFVLVLWGFAVIGWWRFGRVRHDFQDISTAMLTQFDAILGPPGALPLNDGQKPNFEYLAFAFLAHFVNFFFLTNFFLAIVVDAYSKVMTKVEKSIVDQNALLDCLALIENFFMRQRNRWPTEGEVIKNLKLSNKDFISPEDLFPECGFKSQRQAETWYDYYKKYDFLLEPQTEVLMDDVFLSHANTDKMVDKLISKLSEDGSFKFKGDKPSPTEAI